MESRNAKFDKDAWSSKSQVPLAMTKEVEGLAAPKGDLLKSGKSDSDQQASKSARGACLPSNSAKKASWLT